MSDEINNKRNGKCESSFKVPYTGTDLEVLCQLENLHYGHWHIHQRGTDEYQIKIRWRNYA